MKLFRKARNDATRWGPVWNTMVLVRRKQARHRINRHRTPRSHFVKLETMSHNANLYRSLDACPQGGVEWKNSSPDLDLSVGIDDEEAGNETYNLTRCSLSPPNILLRCFPIIPADEVLHGLIPFESPSRFLLRQKDRQGDRILSPRPCRSKAAAGLWQPQEEGLREIIGFLEQQISRFSDRSQMSQQIEYYNRFPEFNNYIVFIIVSAEVVSSSRAFLLLFYFVLLGKGNLEGETFFNTQCFHWIIRDMNEKRYPDIIDHVMREICFTPQFLYTYECIPEQRGTCCPCPPFMDRNGPADDPCIIQLLSLSPLYGQEWTGR
ncbi:hypothetical protein C4D60_Mb08t07470 [Musa balbisiana]|uniref:Uncharacterized protein n=1 Tax=Musa balbisiana TaxID=52838 RepID=A0A4S8K233_MUSBA|nr:hypothetical protein C4D60_Mb08t07470 [Musa balbisiana]